MVAIDTDLSYLTSYYELNIKRNNPNAYKSIDESTDAQASGSSQLKNTDLDQNMVIKALKLNLPSNRLYILKLLNHTELVALLFLIQKDKLAMGLKFFNKPRLMQYIYDLPKEEILKVLFSIYSKENFLSTLPMKELMAFLGSKKIDKNEFIKLFKSMPKHLLAQIYEAGTGKAAGKMTQEELVKELEKTNQGLLVEGMRSLPYKQILEITSKLLEKNPELFLEFSKPSLVNPIAEMSKVSVVEGMKALEPELIIKMLNDLPNQLLAVINTMVEEDKFTEFLQKYRADLLQELVTQ